MSKERIQSIKNEANSAKEKLMSLEDKLLNNGAIKEAEQLNKIIAKLELWQNR